MRSKYVKELDGNPTIEGHGQLCVHLRYRPVLTRSKVNWDSEVCGVTVRFGEDYSSPDSTEPEEWRVRQ